MRNSTIDLLKAFASQIIVMHHLLLYTPMSQILQAEWTGILGVIAEDGRYLVQVFLVIAGYLGSQSMFKMLELRREIPIWPLLKKRYMRLAKPFWAAIGVAVLLSWLAGKIAMNDQVADLPSFVQLLAHVFLVHDIVGVEALSAGVWYVAIDLQLFSILVAMTWATHKLGPNHPLQATRMLGVLLGIMAAASLWWWNRNSAHDAWAWYFFGSYGLGAIACWAQRENKTAQGTVLITLLMGAALWIEWRERLVLTGLTALLLMYSVRIEALASAMARGPVRWLGEISYSVFLIHYGITVFASSVVIALGIEGLGMNVLAFVVTWAISVGAGWVLYRLVERG